MTDEIPAPQKVPDNMGRAIDLLRRQQYHEVADFLEGEYGDD